MAVFETELTHAVASGNFEQVQRLLREGHDANEQNAHGDSPMAVAAMGDSVELLELLFEHGGAVDSSNDSGWTPLHFAVDYSIDSTIHSGGEPGDEPIEVISWLLLNGTRCDLKTCDGATPRDVAAAYKSQRPVELIDSHLIASKHQ